ncbi:uncharacterized protein Gasu_60870 [Galdieria sulphuraria]|uniref:Uncharacterized protein n=1 Tax=Galdieria sulphuraria TaxID=130081 RepID=M2X8X5_GALSU|nr:uncharacterized protein Gasu_60870 [Galdieria sulphuraria]EME26272.1 hypothetical protein Gasu_60870 [Galdieria sulphuraria]|eukprot:XP_005702792.1 hypothetical protein Gasu_60870 [Galdieria sulphuraria]
MLNLLRTIQNQANKRTFLNALVVSTCCILFSKYPFIFMNDKVFKGDLCLKPYVSCKNDSSETGSDVVFETRLSEVVIG